MIRVRSKADPELVGTVVEDAGDGDLWVQWDDHEHPGQRWRIGRARVEEIEKPRDIHLALLDALDRLRDSFNLAVECCIRDIQREMKK